MLLFSERRKLARLFDDWRARGEGGVTPANCPENVIAFLCSKGLINEEKAKEYLNTTQPKNKK